MTTRNSTAAQLQGEKIKKAVKRFTIFINILSAIGILLFVIISKYL